MNTAALYVAAPVTITVENRETLRADLMERVSEGVPDVIVGLEATSYIDSTGLAMLAGLHRVIVRERGGRLRISGANSELLRLFEATCLSSVLEMMERGPTDGTAEPPEPMRAQAQGR